MRGTIRISAPEDHNPDGTVKRWTAESDLVPGYPYTYSSHDLAVRVDWGDDTVQMAAIDDPDAQLRRTLARDALLSAFAGLAILALLAYIASK